MHLALDLGREVSPAAYLKDHRSEITAAAGGDPDWDDVVRAALETGLALEAGDRTAARRAWARALKLARRQGRRAARDGHGPRALLCAVGHLRDAADLVLFDGRLPSDLAARAARLVAKMSGRWSDRALCSYWEAAAAGDEDLACGVREA